MGERWPAVVVGVDGSWEALRAVSWAAREAAAHRAPLHLVHAYVWPQLWVAASVPSSTDGRLRYGEGILVDAERVALRDAPGVVVRPELVMGPVVPVLVTASLRAALLVVGSRGLEPVGCLVAGSTTAGLLGRSAAPVVVVRSEPVGYQRGLIVVGFDGSPAADNMIAMAFDIAAHRGGRVLAVQVVPLPFISSDAAAEGPAAPMLATLKKWSRMYPHVESTPWVAAGHPGAVLAELSDRAGLIVVGSRDWGGFWGTTLGSVGPDVIHHARCPLMIVPPRTRTRRWETDTDTGMVAGGRDYS